MLTITEASDSWWDRLVRVKSVIEKSGNSEKQIAKQGMTEKRKEKQSRKYKVHSQFHVVSFFFSFYSLRDKKLIANIKAQ